MKGEAVAASLLLLTLAFALAFVPRRTALPAGVAAIVATAAIALTFPAPAPGIAFGGCWIALILAALGVYWPAPMRGHAGATIIGAAIAGSMAGLVLASGERWPVLPLAPGFALLAIVARACVERGWAIALRVGTSWLLAVALLVGAIPYMVNHPGYVPDHRE